MLLPFIRKWKKKTRHKICWKKPIKMKRQSLPVCHDKPCCICRLTSTVAWWCFYFVWFFSSWTEIASLRTPHLLNFPSVSTTIRMLIELLHISKWFWSIYEHLSAVCIVQEYVNKFFYDRNLLGFWEISHTRQIPEGGRCFELGI
jgi:hypothetical protein